MSLDPERRAVLQSAKLVAVVREHGDAHGWDAGGAAGSLGGDASLLDPSGRRGWVLADEEPERALGRALAWATTRGVQELHIVVDAAHHSAAGHLARRATYFELAKGAPRLWSLAPHELSSVTAVPYAIPVEPEVTTLELGALLADAGAEVVVEHGIVTGEVEGLEIARIVQDDAGTRVEVGVGRNDREAFAMLHGHLPTHEALAKVIATVREHRRDGRPAHPLNRLAAERWLRRRLVAEPGLVGLAHLEPIEPPLPRTSLADAAAAFALGTDESGAPVLVAASVGVDVDVIPAAVDLWAAGAPEAKIRIVVPERDALAVTHRIAAAAVAPVQIHPIADDWRG